ncbi:MAG: protein kinase domain-containing protein [Isosphaeraceae bacterium]
MAVPRPMDREGSGEAPRGASASEVSRESSPRDDSRVIAALEAYLDSLREGRPYSRDEFLARHAEIADALGECLSGLEFIQTAAGQFVASNSGRPSCQAELVLPRAQLGDYRVIREVGRGGMGVVYEAEQVSLGRRVALKVLPFAAAIDPKQRQRFQIEAQAAAQLHHPHIVPIIGVGCDGGIHYYAMQFVEGRSLAAIVRELRSSDSGEVRQALDSPVGTEEATSAHGKPQGVGPVRTVANQLGAGEPIPDPVGDSHSAPNAGPPEGGRGFPPTHGGAATRDRAFCRHVARIGADAADALDHAHGLGILHRDIKPANLLIDRHGAVWITDFGLARFHGELSLTGTGDVVGTLRYMSPEQALARRGVVDQRTDIYALGATLYELLTLRPAFDGRDHQELLRQIAVEEPARPRRLNPAIPRDLETIVLKAMAKELPRRYATAQELSADLGRFLDDRPIVARRPGLLEHIHRQSRRHWKQLATALAIVLVSMVIGTIVTWDALAKVLAARREEHEYIRETFPLIDKITMEAMSHATRLLQGETDPTTRSDTLQVYELAERFYRRASKLAPSERDNRETRTIVARAHSRLGFTEAVLSTVRLMQPAPDPRLNVQDNGDSRRLRDQAESDYRRSIDLFDKLLAEAPGDRAIRRFHADALGTWGWGWYLNITGRIPEAETLYRRAIPIWRELVRNPDPRGVSDALSGPISSADLHDLLSLVDAVHALNRILDSTRRVDEADELRRQLEDDTAFAAKRLAGPEYQAVRRYWASHFVSDGHEMLSKLDDRRSAATDFRMAFILDPESDIVQNNLAWMLASVPGEPWFDPTRALALARKAVELDSTRWVYWNTLGVAAFRLRDWKTAEDALRKASQFDASGGSALNGFFLAMTLWQRGLCEDARQMFDQAVGWMKKENPVVPEVLRFHGEAAGLMGLSGPEPRPGRRQDEPARMQPPKLPAKT